jgi:hypothetical protein
MDNKFAFVDIDFETIGPDHKPIQPFIVMHNEPFERKRKKEYKLGKTLVIESKRNRANV